MVIKDLIIAHDFHIIIIVSSTVHSTGYSQYTHGSLYAVFVLTMQECRAYYRVCACHLLHWFLHWYKHTHTRARAHTHTHTHTHTCTYTHTHMHTHIHIYTTVHTTVHTHTHTHTHTTYTCTHSYVHTYTHTHMHNVTLILCLLPPLESLINLINQAACMWAHTCTVKTTVPGTDLL